MRWWFPVSLRAVARTEPGRDPFPASGAACWVILCQQGFTMDPATVSTSSSCNCTLFPAVLLVMALLMAAHKLGLLCQLWHKVEPKSPRHGGELVAEVLKAHRVRYLFTLVGGHISPILVASEKLGIRVVDTRHEATAVFAADAVARLSGTVGVAAVTAGPGVTNTITAVKNAQMAESPVLLIGGAASRLQKGRGALQDIDQMSLLRPLCKFCASVQTVREIVPVLRRAIATAQSDTPGPVFVEFPVDVLYPYHLVEKELTPKGSPKTFIAKAMSWYQHNFLRNLFAGAWETQDLFPLPVHVPQATAKQVQQCVELVSRAKKPIILLGSQVTLPPTPVKELRAALEDLAIPCFLGGMARGMLGRDSPLHIHQNRREALKEADVVILAGSVCDFRLSYGRVLSRYSKIIAVNRNRSQLLLNSDIFWKPQVAIQGDASSFLLCLSRGLKGYSCPQDWAASLKDNDHQKEKANREKAEKPTEQHLNPLKVLHRMDALLPENSLLVLDGGDFVGSAAYIVQPPGPLCWLDPGTRQHSLEPPGPSGHWVLGVDLLLEPSSAGLTQRSGSSMGTAHLATASWSLTPLSDTRLPHSG
ncbi:2-hydroxyacyl-CoA lyase 2 isoform X4 [Alligator mississippiensis]|uniref:2-hydroxyacyl-CoA lyase 2 isoform X4 n=1 Tax=Alligator mississippiensis TaxID=8496 RepID=UPI002877AA02|nr:2-hydroxyacyl-CoA lyase 2 isoform X4 [Alligator mississippiensis]